jgi:hypothetical protein
VTATTYCNSSRNSLRVLFIPILLLFVLYGCSTEPSDIIDSTYNTPFILNFSVSPEEVNTDTILVNGTAHPADSITLSWTITADIAPRDAGHLLIFYRINDTKSTAPLNEGILAEIRDPVPSVTISEDIGSRIARADVGRLSITLRAETPDGLSSNTLTRTTNVFRANRPPEIVSVDAPDTLIVTGDTPFEITVITDDPDGVDDVVRVHFYYTNPNNVTNPAPISLNIVEPGIFRSGFRFDETNTKGTHKLEFQAFDRMNEGSEKYLHTIEIK